MSDLVERLRKWGTGAPNLLLLHHEAADRIEALEKALREIANQKLVPELEEDGDFEYAYEAIIEIARAALPPSPPETKDTA